MRKRKNRRKIELREQRKTHREEREQEQKREIDNTDQDTRRFGGR